MEIQPPFTLYRWLILALACRRFGNTITKRHVVAHA